MDFHDFSLWLNSTCGGHRQIFTREDMRKAYQIGFEYAKNEYAESQEGTKSFYAHDRKRKKPDRL